MKRSYVASSADLANLTNSGKILSEALKLMAAKAVEGANLMELEALADAEIKKRGGEPSFKGFQGYPAASCLSLNEAIVHGLPHDRVLVTGDVLGIDLGVIYNGWYTDAATTVAIGLVDPAIRELMASTKRALERAISLVKLGIRLGVISHAIEQVAKEDNLGIIKSLSGHGIGKHFHEPPQIPNYGKPTDGPELGQGQVLAIEPMFSTGSGEVELGPDGWTVRCTDGIGSHHEATVLVTKTGTTVLTTLP
ncbi:type I methionyl aminopeptidase [Candidatus Berkelbacteria bacterium]|nr:type I methionyl aminopeptidase [Candidatus Berkelbacteria bacterium]